MIKLDLRIGAEMLETRKVVEKWAGNDGEEWIKKEGPWNTKSWGCPR